MGFDRFVAFRGHSTLALTKELMESWVTVNPNHTRTIRHKLIILREFAKYLQRLGIPACADFEVPKKNYAFKPYIFSTDELSRLFNAADAYIPLTKATHKHLVIQLFLRLLYHCGLRLSDACNLTVQDVNLQDGILHIKKGKFEKERFVPMPASLAQKCRDYSSIVHKNSNSTYPFLPTVHGTAYSNRGFYGVFRDLLWQANISHGGRGYGPRVHDLRHTFAVHRLRDWVYEGRDMHLMLPYLSTYLGHKHILETETYLSLTSELFPDILARLETHFSDLIPDIWEGSDDEN